MNIVLSDLLHEILLHLDDASIVNLKVSHSRLNDAIEGIYKNNIFWLDSLRLSHLGKAMLC